MWSNGMKVQGYLIRPSEQVTSPALAKILASVRAAVGGERFSGLYAVLAETIQRLDLKRVILLDYGCGAMGFSSRLMLDRVVDDFVGMDIFPAPIVTTDVDPIWSHYRQVPTKGRLLNDKHFDVTMVIDALHHADEDQHLDILLRIAEVTDYILVKDHFEYGYVSRQLLRLLDFYGNYAFGVNIPARYYNRERWSKLVYQAGLHEHKLQVGVKIHRGVIGILIPSKLHFISLLSKKQTY